ncbi:MAG: folylpolyglutamate synthase/dihydrofolate synthase family protein [Lentisphaerota bacterium]
MQDYQSAIQKLCSLEFFGIKLGLQNLAELLSLLGNPQNSLKFIHVAGTNGKGSVCAILSKTLEKSGFNVGFFSSPHLVTIRERFRFNSKGISESELAAIINELWPLIDELYKKDIKITFFEATVAIALIYFKRRECDFVVWETGMGGRLDGTNIVNPIVTAITTINYDHQQYLGNTLEDIAFEKAGIIKMGIPLFVGKILKNPLNVIKKRAAELNSKVFCFDENLLSFREPGNRGMNNWRFSVNNEHNPKVYELSLPGEFQERNMILAYSILKYLSMQCSFDLTLALLVLKEIKWHARCQTLPDGKILDGAHNQEGVNALVSSIKESFSDSKFTVIFGCLAERNPKEIILKLSEVAERFIFTPIKTSRKSYEPLKIVELMRSDKAFTTEAFVVNSSKEALAMAGNSKTLIAGSLYMAGEILSQYYTEDDITII